jgi:choline dehydrogenase-like flavoprotein
MTSGNGTSTEFDAIVVGSGITGAGPRELTERGLRTLVLERGRHMGMDHSRRNGHLPCAPSLSSLRRRNTRAIFH